MHYAHFVRSSRVKKMKEEERGKNKEEERDEVSRSFNPTTKKKEKNLRKQLKAFWEKTVQLLLFLWLFLLFLLFLLCISKNKTSGSDGH